MRRLHSTLMLCLLSATAMAAGDTGRSDDKPVALNFTMKNIDGQEVDLSQYKGKVVLVVNVASACGLTPQYKQLQALHEQYAEKGLVILGFPCNQFRGQEPGTDQDIKAFCEKDYGVEFDLFSKIEVNGDGACDFYKHLTGIELDPAGKGPVTWNFEKFLIDRDGKPIARFAPRTKPDDKQIIAAIESALGK